MNPLNGEDLKVRPLSMTSVPKSIPRNVTSQVVWDVVKLDGVLTASATAVVENNFSYSLAQHPQASIWTQLFDQWALPFFSIEFDSLTTPGDQTTVPTLYTALDFDSANTINTIANIEDFGSSEASVMQPSVRVLRSVRPSTKNAVASSTSTPQAVLGGPVWIDSSFTTIPHYGIRSMLSISSALQVKTTSTLYFCFRNSI